MKFWKIMGGGLLLLGLFFGLGWWWVARTTSGKTGDLKCDSFGLPGVIVGCDYRVDKGQVITEAVRLQKIVKKKDQVLMTIKRNDSKMNVITEDVLIGQESDSQPVMAVFYLDFKIPTGDSVKLKGNPKTALEFEKIFVSDKLKNREAMMDLIISNGQQPRLGSLYLYQP